MRMINVYLDNAMRFERLAAEEPNTMLKTEFEKRANAYRRLFGSRGEGCAAPGWCPCRGLDAALAVQMTEIDWHGRVQG
jgi:hypothetical protein